MATTTSSLCTWLVAACMSVTCDADRPRPRSRRFALPRGLVGPTSLPNSTFPLSVDPAFTVSSPPLNPAMTYYSPPTLLLLVLLP
ncbi:hypothetical protein SESBI_15726 [Sesbania bispinosa]|nr:hypothetical protein SESBI_15726 [Sesbania bispinosa]